MRKSICLAMLCLGVASLAAAQQFDFAEAGVADSAALSKAVPVLAKRVVAVYKDVDRDNYLNNLFRLQMQVAAHSTLGARSPWPTHLHEVVSAEDKFWLAQASPWPDTATGSRISPDYGIGIFQVGGLPSQRVVGDVLFQRIQLLSELLHLCLQ
jgi:hypothetical protein